MPKRRRLLTSVKKRSTPSKYRYSPIKEEPRDGAICSPRGRLKGALKDVLDPLTADDSDDAQPPITKRLMKIDIKKPQSETESSEDEEYLRTPYVLKLFDRSVDLSQFSESSPLYPICRAWIANQPKLCYKKFGKQKYPSNQNPLEESIELPGPEGPPVSRIPKLLPEQEERNKDNINLNYDEAPPPDPEYLLNLHCARWRSVRRAWIQQSAKVEERYSATQELLNKINVFSN